MTDQELWEAYVKSRQDLYPAWWFWFVMISGVCACTIFIAFFLMVVLKR